MKAIRNSIAILLCGLFIYNSMGYMLIFSVIRANYRNQVFAEISKLPEDSLFVIDLPDSDRNKLKKGKRCLEIKLNGQMYDIVKSVSKGNYTTYYCVRDIKEEQLISKFNRVNNQTEGNAPISKSTRLILDNIIKSALLSENKIIDDFPIIVQYFFVGKRKYSSPMLNTLVPPPQS